MNIGEAIAMMRDGKLVRRPNWEPYVCIFLVPARHSVRAYLQIQDREGMQFPWTPLSWDLLADDYEVTP